MKPDDLEPTISGDEDTLAPPKELAAPQPPEPSPKERYAFGEELARGGLGKIVRAHDQRLRRPVALKQLLHPSAEDEVRFLREALLTARLEHPAIIPIHDVGHDPQGQPFYAMKLVEGRSLAAVLAEKKTLAERLSMLPHIIAVCEALAYAHSQHTIHRDLKPQNVLVGPFGETVVIDWGLAKDVTKEDTSRLTRPPSGELLMRSELTVDGSVMGTPAYMPPEQAQGKPVDARADVYSLGAMIYHLLAGASPYPAKSGAEALKKLSLGPPPALETLQPEAPRDLLAIVEKAMQRDPAGRYPTAKELAEDLKKFQTGQLVSAYHYSRGERVRRFLMRHRTAVGVAAVLLTILFGLAVFSYVSIVKERDLAEGARVRAERARDQETERADEATLQQALLALDNAPWRALALLSRLSEGYPNTSAVRLLAADALSRQIPRVIPVPGAPIIDVAFSKDGSRVAALHKDGAISLLTPLTWSSTTIGHAEGALGLRFSDDGGLLAVWGATLTLYRPGQLNPPVSLNDHTDRIADVAFSPDGSRLLSGGQDKLLRLWDLSCESLACGAPQRLVAHPSPIYDVAFSPDGSRFASGGRDGALFLWTLSTLKPLALKGHSLNVSQLDFFPDGERLASAGRDGSVRIWSVKDGTNLDTFIIPDDGSTDFAISPDGSRLSVGSSGGFLWLWNLPCDEPEPTELLKRCGARVLLGAHPKPVDQITFLNSRERVASFSYDGLLSVWDLNTGSRRSLHCPSRYARLSPDGQSVLAGAPGGLYLWSLESLPAQRFDPDKGYPLAFSSDAKLLGYSLRVEFRVFNLQTQQHLSFSQHEKVVSAADFSLDGRYAATAGQDHDITLYDLVSKQERKLSGHTDLVRSVAFSPDGRWLASGSWDKTVRLWDLSDPKAPREAQVLRGHESYVRSVAFSPDSKRLASGGLDGRVLFWGLEGELLSERGSFGAIAVVRFSPDQETFLVGNSEGELRVFSLDGTQEKTLKGHSYTINCVAFSADGQSLASADVTQELRLWDLSDWRKPHAEVVSRVLLGHTRSVGALLFTPDGYLLSASRDGSILRWPDDLPRERAALNAYIKEAAAPFQEQ